ncbi:MAG: hypothetical protein ACOC32_00155 [Nanoarchaeota archaeon]
MLFNMIPNKLFILRCPNCKKEMKYKENLNSPCKHSDIMKKSKRCVFCGTSFKVRPAILCAYEPQDEALARSSKCGITEPEMSEFSVPKPKV